MKVEYGSVLEKLHNTEVKHNKMVKELNKLKKLLNKRKIDYNTYLKLFNEIEVKYKYREILSVTVEGYVIASVDDKVVAEVKRSVVKKGHSKDVTYEDLRKSAIAELVSYYEDMDLKVMNRVISKGIKLLDIEISSNIRRGVV